MNKRLGFACKWIDNLDQVDGIKPDDVCKKYNTKSTTVTWLNRQSQEVAETRLWDLMQHNIESVRLLVEKVGTQDEHLRMCRLGSDILPVYTHPTWSYFWNKTDVVQYASTHFAEVGDLARKLNVRLSFHPGQFVVLASVNEGIVERSIEEFEYHADMARWMGFGKKFNDFKINVHISGKQGPAGIRAAYKRLSPEARSCLTIENEENSWGLNDCLELADILPIVLDLHHFWIREGEYISTSDPRIQQVVDSWRGVRPTFHYSQSRADYLLDHDTNVMPNMQALLDTGFKKQKLRAHSDTYWNTAVNEYALTHLAWGDCMAESKSKNLASFALSEQASQLGML